MAHSKISLLHDDRAPARCCGGCGSRSHSAPVAPAHSRPLRVMAEARSPSLCAQCCEGHEQVTNTVGGVKLTVIALGHPEVHRVVGLSLFLLIPLITCYDMLC